MKIISSLIFAFFSLFIISQTVQASAVVHSGTNCEAANLRQGLEFFSWSKDGITNNHPSIGLYVICPVDIDVNDWDVTPELFIQSTIFLPPGYGTTGDAGPTCVLRAVSPPVEGMVDDVTIVSQFALQIGTYNPIVSGNGVTNTAGAGLAINNTSDTVSAHLLCLLPPRGGTLVTYISDQQ